MNNSGTTLRGIKVQIYPTHDLVCYIANLLGCTRKVFNELLVWRKSEYEEFNRFHDDKEINKHLTLLKQELTYLQNVNSKVLQQSMRNCNQAFYNFFRGLKTGLDIGFPEFKSKKDKQSCRFPSDMFNRKGYVCKKIKNNKITLCTELTDVLFKCSKRDTKILNKYQDRIKSVTLTKTKSGIYFLSILIDIPIFKLVNKTDKVIGLDLGIKDFIVDSDGNRYENLKTYRNNQKLIARLNRLLSRKVKGSNNREKSRLRLAKFYEKLTNRKNTYLHQISSKIVNENQVICIEDLNVKGMMKNHKLAKSILEVSFGEFRRQLEYKCKWYGRELVIIDRYYPSSKRCNVCGYIKKDLTLKDREWICPECGLKHDRDYNAALNIRDKGHMMYYLSGFNL